MNDPGLNRRIGHFYDRSSPLWLKVWGEHMHHGYYGADGKTPKNHGQAQVDMIKTLLQWGGVNQVGRALDAGCGAGGSARYLASHFGADVLGVTLSSVQAQAAERLTEAAGLKSRIKFKVNDMMKLDASAGLFDLIWSMESAEHIPDKAEMMRLFYRLMAPGGRLLLATWCCRDSPPALTAKENRILNKICELYHLPPMISRRQLADHASAAGFSAVQTENWSDAVAPFWNAVVRSAFQWNSLTGLFKAGWPTIKGAWAMRYMLRGYREGALEFVVLKAEKAQA